MLPAPNLDDRRFQDLVDEAKRRIQQHCPEWTDHNVSDPGVTLVELFAWMTDLMVYRLNRVPDRHYVKYLELLDVRLFPPAAAHAMVTFWLTAKQEQDVVVPAGTIVSTERIEGFDPVLFTSTEELVIKSCELTGLGTSPEGGEFEDRLVGLSVRQGFECFDEPPSPGDCLYVGLSSPFPNGAVALRIECHIDGVGVNPANPPLRWEAQVGSDWLPCEVDRDDTGGLNQPGDVVLHLPDGHSAGTQHETRAGWLRCIVSEAEPHQPPYTKSPRIHSIDVVTMGATVDCVHARVVDDELMGLSEGISGQRFLLAHRPVLLDNPAPVLQVRDGEEWVTWERVENFADSTATDAHFRLDASSGEVEFGPAVRQQDGTVTHYGAVPPEACAIRMLRYASGGGRTGNVAERTIKVDKSSHPFVHDVVNRRAAAGGVDPESLESAKRRGPLQLRTRNRAVTAEDFELLTREAVPEIGRVRCLPDPEAFGARVLVVANASRDDDGELRLTQLIPDDDTIARIVGHLDARRVVGTRVLVQPATLAGVTVVANVLATRRADHERVRRDCLVALNAYFDPIRGGPEGDGWPFGRPITVGDVYPVLARVPGVQLVEDARLFGADPLTGDRGDETSRIDISPTALAVSYRHTVRVRAAV